MQRQLVRQALWMGLLCAACGFAPLQAQSPSAAKDAGKKPTAPATPLNTPKAPQTGAVRKASPAARAAAVTPAIPQRPNVTPTPNTNLLAYTEAMAAWWELTGMEYATDREPDGAGGHTASHFSPSLTDVAHVVTWDPKILTGATPTAYTLTMLAKADAAKPAAVSSNAPATGSFFDLGVHAQTGLRSVGRDNWFDLSNCTVTRASVLQVNVGGTGGGGFNGQGTGGQAGFQNGGGGGGRFPPGMDVTATAAPAAGGFCKLQLSFTVAPFTYLDGVYFTGAPAATSIRFTGSGNGFSAWQPQLALGAATPAAYQAIEGTHTYCVAAYFGDKPTNRKSAESKSTDYKSGETTPGCSTVADSAAEVNRIDVPAVPGAAFCRVFRGGGISNGALTVRNSTHIACGSSVTDDGLTADGTPPPAASTPYDSRPTRSAITEYKYCNAGYACRIFTAGPGVSGTINSLHISVGNANPDTVKLAVRCDGAAQPQVVDTGTFFMAQDYPTTPFQLDNLGIGNPARDEWSANRTTEINFTNGCTIDLQTPTRQMIFADVIYHLGRRLSKPSRAVWHAQLTPLTDAKAMQLLDLLPQINAEGGGEMESATLFVTPNNMIVDYHYLEGNPTIFTDNNLAVTSNGTEDFFGSGWYFANGKASVQTNKWGDFIGAGLSQKQAPGDALMYRFFGDIEPVFFERSLRMTWQPGQESEGATAVRYKALVTYWTAR